LGGWQVAGEVRGREGGGAGGKVVNGVGRRARMGAGVEAGGVGAQGRVVA